VSDSTTETAVEPESEAGVEPESEAGVEPESEAGVEPESEAGVEPESEAGVEPDPREPELDPETAARRAAALAQIRQFGDPVLRTRARPIDRFDDELQEEIARMGRLMDDAIGVGLAATQVGVVHRLLVYRIAQDAELAALINPEVEWSGRDSESMEEGCLSLPGVLVEVDRPVHVRVRALDEHGEPIVIEASGLEARVIQHEIDHLDGVLILDRTSRDQRKEAMRTLREAQEAA
jgi:peptide deformylase